MVISSSAMQRLVSRVIDGILESKTADNIISDKNKVVLADVLLGDVLKSTEHSIGGVMAERIIGKVIKSTGNNVTSFMVQE
jgi:hypothetical protein